MTTRRGKALPEATPDTRPFWEACKRHELRIQHCNSCNQHYFYPRQYCPHCFSDQTEWRTISGKGTLLTYLISHRSAPGFENETPYAVAIVQLAEGPHMMTNIVNVEIKPENLPAGMPVEVAWDDATDDITLPKFQPAGGRGA